MKMTCGRNSAICQSETFVTIEFNYEYCLKVKYIKMLLNEFGYYRNPRFESVNRHKCIPLDSFRAL